MRIVCAARRVKYMDVFHNSRHLHPKLHTPRCKAVTKRVVYSTSTALLPSVMVHPF